MRLAYRRISAGIKIKSVSNYRQPGISLKASDFRGKYRKLTMGFRLKSALFAGMGIFLVRPALAANPRFDPICSKYVASEHFRQGDTTFWEMRVLPAFAKT